MAKKSYERVNILKNTSNISDETINIWKEIWAKYQELHLKREELIQDKMAEISKEYFNK
jgi:hypothetical protein